MTTKITSDNIAANTILTTNLAASTIAALQGTTSPTITQIQITDSSYVVKDDTAVSTSGGYIKITGTNFTAGSQVVIGSVPATSVGFVNSTTLNVQVPAQAAGTYVVYVTINTGSVAIIVNGLTYSGDPAWVTSSALPGGQVGSAISVQLSATGDAPVTYVLQAGSSLPAGLSLTSGGLLSGTVTGITVETTYNFTIEAIDGQAQESPRTFSITITVSDQYFENVTTLLSANNPASTFVTDASTNNFAVSVFGDTRPNNFGPYTPGYYSAYFDGTGDYLVVADNPALEIGDGVDFTLELWFYAVTATAARNAIFTKSQSGIFAPYSINIMSDLTVTYYSSSNGSSWNVANAVSFGSVSLGTWNHVAVSRSGSSIRLFLNGALSTTLTFSGALYDDAVNLGIGARNDGTEFFNGYISNARLVKGTAIYTSAFTPPTQPLTAVTNTQLLVCSSNRFIDNSTNNFTITRNGDTSISGFDPFAPNSSYSSYGSGYFDGTGDYLSIPTSAPLVLSGGVWTIEAWIYPDGDYTNFRIIVNKRSGSSAASYDFYLNQTNGFLAFYNGTAYTSTTAPTANSWSHVAAVYDGTNINLYMNGTRVLQSATSNPDNGGNLFIGADDNGTSNYFRGYMSNVRILKGTALYTGASYTVPTAPLTAIANTSLLTLQNNQPNNNNMFLDSSTNNFVITRNGNTTQGSFSPYGGGWSNYFDGTGDCLTVPSNTAFAFGTGDFTIECWVYLTAYNSTYGSQIFGGHNFGVGADLIFIVNTTGKLYFQISGSSTGAITSTSSVSLNTWTHVAIVRNGGTVTPYINGTNAGGGASYTTSVSSTINPGIGSSTNNNNSAALTGYISNLRVVSGTAVYTGAFTPSTAPLTPIANTSLLTCADNRFIDDSANNFTITRNGDVSVQRFNPFNPVLTTPTSYSGYFDGNEDYLTAPSNTAFQFGTGAFTIEAWIYTTKASGVQNIWSQRSASVNGITFRLGTSRTLEFFYDDVGSGAVSTTATVPINTWTHVAITKSSNTITLWINGVSSATGSNSVDVGSTQTPFIGRSGVSSLESFQGYISNVRAVKGTAVYTSAFTPSTSPLTAVSGTSLLTLQNATFIDNSTNNFTITANGDSVPRQFNPFGWTSTTGGNAVYSVANYGGGMYFDGTGDNLLVNNSSVALGSSNNWTVECWIYPTVSAQGVIWFNGTNGSDNNRIQIMRRSTNTIEAYGTGDSGNFGPIETAANTVALNSWHHIVLVKNSTNVRIYVNGVSSASGTVSGTLPTVNTFYIGYGRAGGGDTNFGGYISNLRSVKGQALYTSNFAPPVAPLSFNTNTVLQANGTSAAIYDSSMITTYETVGNATSSTVIKKYGNSSLYFDGSGDYLSTPTAPTLVFGTGNFTVEMWLYTSTTADQLIFDMRPNGGNGAYPTLYYSGGVLAWLVNSANQIVSSAIAQNTWYHVAVSRSGTSTRMFINGTQSGSTYTDSTNYLCSRLFIGASSSGGGTVGFNGYLDDLRITNGVARYTGNFTPPTSPVIQF